MLYFLQDFSFQFSLPQLSSPIQNQTYGNHFMNPRSLIFSLSILLLPFLSVSAAVPSNWASGDYDVGSLVIHEGTTYIATQQVTASQGDPKTTTAYWSSLDTLAGTKSTPTGQPGTTPDTTTLSDLSVPSDTNGTTAGNTAKMVRVNIRGTVSPDEEVNGVTIPGARIVSFKLAFDDNSTTATSDVLIRGIGPGLSGTEGGTNYATDYTPLPNPKLYVERFHDDLSGQTDSVTDNLDWGNQRQENQPASSVSSAAASMSIPIDLNSKDAAALYSFNYGFYTFPVQSEDGQSGVAWVGADKINLNDGSRFTHCSCRGDVGTGGDIMILSFEIVGEVGTTAQVLVRGRGASLANLGVPSGYLQDTVLEIEKFNDVWVGEPLEGQVSSNDDWTSLNNSTINTIATSLDFNVGFEDKDSALLLDLAPGYYTAKLKGKNDTTGIGWVAVDEVP